MIFLSKLSWIPKIRMTVYILCIYIYFFCALVESLIPSRIQPKYRKSFPYEVCYIYNIHMKTVKMCLPTPYSKLNLQTLKVRNRSKFRPTSPHFPELAQSAQERFVTTEQDLPQWRLQSEVALKICEFIGIILLIN